RFGWVATRARLPALLPVCSAQATTWVAPFQLTDSCGVPVVEVTTAAGSSAGVATQGKRSVRYVHRSSGRAPSRRTRPSGPNSVKYGAVPQLTSQLPFA